MRELFGIAKGTNILKQEFYKYFVVTEASKNEDQCIKLRMKGDIDKVIDELTNLYVGIEKLPRLDPMEVEETLRPGAARALPKTLPPKDICIPSRVPAYNNDFDIPVNYRGRCHLPEESTPVSQSTESIPNRTSSNGSRSGSGVSNIFKYILSILKIIFRRKVMTSMLWKENTRSIYKPAMCDGIS